MRQVPDGQDTHFMSFRGQRFHVVEPAGFIVDFGKQQNGDIFVEIVGNGFRRT